MQKIGAGLSVLLLSLLFWGGVGHADGKADFEAKCKMCHGADGKGNPAMVASMGPNIDLTKGSGDCVAVVTGGKGKMPAYKDKLSAEQIAAICEHIKTLK